MIDFEGIDKKTARKFKGKSKAKALFLHSVMRCRERYGVDLDWKKYNEMCNMIRNQGTRGYKYFSDRVLGRIKFLGTQTNSRTVWRLKSEGKEFTVVYNKLHNMIATFLPEGATPYGWEED